MAQPPPLSPAARRLMIGSLVLGIVVMVVEGIHVILAKDSDIGIVDAMIGSVAAAMIAFGAINLFHRPDR